MKWDKKPKDHKKVVFTPKSACVTTGGISSSRQGTRGAPGLGLNFEPGFHQWGPPRYYAGGSKWRTNKLRNLEIFEITTELLKTT